MNVFGFCSYKSRRERKRSGTSALRPLLFLQMYSCPFHSLAIHSILLPFWSRRRFELATYPTYYISQGGCCNLLPTPFSCHFGAEGEIRTRDLPLTRRLLYQLSYFGLLLPTTVPYSVSFCTSSSRRILCHAWRFVPRLECFLKLLRNRVPLSKRRSTARTSKRATYVSI